MIKIENLRKTFATKIAVNDLSLDVPNGVVYGFLGPNGAGKTTTIKMIVGMLRQDSGKIEIDGIDTLEDPIGSKKKFAYVPDNPDIYETMTARQYLNFMADVFSLSLEKRNENIKKYAEIFEMTENLDATISALSHGMKQKIVLIGALIHEPRLLILDEPMVGLDAKSSFRLKNIMREDERYNSWYRAFLKKSRLCCKGRRKKDFIKLRRYTATVFRTSIYSEI